MFLSSSIYFIIEDFLNNSDLGQNNPMLTGWSLDRPEDDKKHWDKFPSFSPFKVKIWNFFVHHVQYMLCSTYQKKSAVYALIC